MLSMGREFEGLMGGKESSLINEVIDTDRGGIIGGSGFSEPIGGGISGGIGTGVEGVTGIGTGTK